MSASDASSCRPAYLLAAEDLRQNEGQWALYESRGHCVALAGPGSGKTKALTIKLARMLAEEVKAPRGIACLTYSNECVRELRRRLKGLGVAERHNLFVGTVHSFCLQNVLLPYGPLAGLGLPDPLLVATPKDCRMHFDDASIDVYGRADVVRRTTMDWYRRTYVDRHSDDWRVDEEPVFNLIEAYERRLRQNGLVDFDDMMLLGLRIVSEHEWVRRLLRARFPVLVVDEYQDLGLPLHRLVRSLCFEAGMRLLAVGDPDQSIYGFTGARPELLVELAERPDVESVRLQMNYRCGMSIVRASEIVLDHQPGCYACPPDSPVGTIDFHRCPQGIRDQADSICVEIIPSALQRDDCRSLNDIAVLYIDKNDGDVIAEAVKHRGMQAVRIDQNALYPKTLLTRWLEDCAAWCIKGWKKGEPRLSAIIRTWMELCGWSGSSDSQTLQLQRILVGRLWAHRDTTASLGEWLEDIGTNCLLPFLDVSCQQRENRDTLRQMLDSCASGGPLSDWTVFGLAGQGGSPTHLNLITLHSAKGREFDVVIMMGMDQGRIPWADADEWEKAEKRRLFYVGLTRAKREVHMTYSGWYKTGYGTIYRLGPSEFLEHLVRRLGQPQERVHTETGLSAARPVTR